MLGSILGLIKWDNRSLDYSSYAYKVLECSGRGPLGFRVFRWVPNHWVCGPLKLWFEVKPAAKAEQAGLRVSYELQSKLLKGGYIGGHIGDYTRGY